MNCVVGRYRDLKFTLNVPFSDFSVEFLYAGSTIFSGIFIVSRVREDRLRVFRRLVKSLGVAGKSVCSISSS